MFSRLFSLLKMCLDGVIHHFYTIKFENTPFYTIFVRNYNKL
nr:MAG TPA: hypothetical protein [Caudoviricetes sp.]